MIKQRKQVKISLTKVLKIIEFMEAFKEDEAAEDIYLKLAAMLNFKLTDSEIEEFANWYLSKEANEIGYDKDNYDNAKDILESFRFIYCKTEN